MTRALDRNIARSIFLPDGKSLLVGANDGTTRRALDPAAGGPGAPHRRSARSRRRRRSGSTLRRRGTARSPSAAASRAGRPSCTTSPRRPRRRPAADRLQQGRRRRSTSARPRRSTWDGPDGFRSDGVLTYPAGLRGRPQVPAGAATSTAGRARPRRRRSRRAPQLLAAQGWVVFEPNYRGSDNLGNAFQSRDLERRRRRPRARRDVGRRGREEARLRRRVAHRRLRLVLRRLHDDLAARPLSDVWKAAVAGAAVTDWMDQYNLGDGNVARRQLLRRLALDRRPREGVLGAVADRRTRTRSRRRRSILSTRATTACRSRSRIKLYHALKDNGVTTQFVAYPMPGHNAADPVRAARRRSALDRVAHRASGRRGDRDRRRQRPGVVASRGCARKDHPARRP